MLDPEFLAAVEEIRAPLSGTELMAPLLYSLVRSTRPRTVVEVGMGYTTPFVLRALFENRQDFARERELLKKKIEDLFAGGGAASGRGASGGGAGGDAAAKLYREWLESEPAAIDPGFYLAPYEPHLYAFDDLSEGYSSAQRSLDVITRLGLDALLTFVRGDPSGKSGTLPPRRLPIDLAWHDAGGLDAFLDEYWDLVNPAGGMLIVHNTINAWQSNVLAVKNLKLRQVGQFTEFELLSVVEPHKLNQRSFTMVRKTGKFAEKYLDRRRDEVAQNALRFLAGYAPAH